ncbi:MAG: TolC family protein [Variibacter sp.]|nr:TolC family protein [Variibacter sp.]
MVLRISLIGAFAAAGALAQTTSFPKPSYFRETFTKVDSRVTLQPPVRLQDFVVAGKLELSLRSYLELVAANNTEIQIQKLSVETPKNAIMRAFGAFDPLATASFNSTRTKTPATDALAGASTLVSLNQPARFSYAQTLPTGTQYTATFNASKATTNSGFQNFNPALNSSMGLSFVQPLLRNRGAEVNRIAINIARSRVRRSEYDLRNQVMTLLTNAETAFWDVIQARENLRVQESSLNLASESLKRAQRELELGALSPLDIYNPQQQYASAEISVTQARFRLAQVEDALRLQMGADLDPDIRRLPIVLTETVMPSTEAAPTDAEMAVEKALRMRPDLKSRLQALDIDELSIRQAKNTLRPDLSLTGSYTAQGRGGVFYQRSNVFTDLGTRQTIVAVNPGGLGDAFDQMFGFGYPVYAFGLTLRLPIRDRRASADLADALIAKKLDTLQVRNVEQQIRLDVLNAVNQVESSKASVKLALTAQDFARKFLEAEQKKYELGTSQIFFVLNAQNALVAAEAAVVRESVNYRRNVLNLLRRTGELLDVRGVVLQ